MGRVFRLKKKGDGGLINDIGWTDSRVNTYVTGYIDDISDTTTTQKEITSIPSPFARIQLVKEAFHKASGNLHGDSIYNKIVSDTLDVAQLFFNYPFLQDKIDIIEWDKSREIDSLKNSRTPAIREFGDTLDMFLNQDAQGSDPFNFSRMDKIFLMKYKGPKQRSQMHIIGATSPATLFFSTGNDDSAISSNLQMGNLRPFDGNFEPLDQRNPSFIDYMFALKYSMPEFVVRFKALDDYLNAVFAVMDSATQQRLNQIQNSCAGGNYFEDKYDSLTYKSPEGNEHQVQVNGFQLYETKSYIGESDFEIKPSIGNKDVENPLVLPNVKSPDYSKLTYTFGAALGNIVAPFEDPQPIASRRLPGGGIPHPYLTISDFLEDKIVRLPRPIDGQNFFDGNPVKDGTPVKKDRISYGYLLPLKKTFFKYFSVQDLTTVIFDGERKMLELEELGAGVRVWLRIPIKKGFVEYYRNYDCPGQVNASQNHGTVVGSVVGKDKDKYVPDDFAIGVMPPLRFSNPSDAHYRVVLGRLFDADDVTTVNDFDAEFIDDDSNPVPAHFVIRNCNEKEADQSDQFKIYYLENEEFAAARIRISFKDANGQIVSGGGWFIPKFKTYNGTSQFDFAIDLGTSNTHIEYRRDGEASVPFEYDGNDPQISYLFAPDSAKKFLDLNFVPDAIGSGKEISFPVGTVLGRDKVNSGVDGDGKNGSYVAFGNASPAFLYNVSNTKTPYNDFVTNLKWNPREDSSEEYARLYIESLLFMIRCKVIHGGGDLSKTTIIWFYPISMSTQKLNMLESVWNEACNKYFAGGSCKKFTESIAPFKYFQTANPDVNDIVTIDIGGGSTDIVSANLDKSINFIASLRFAANSVFGNDNFVGKGVRHPHNGIILQFKDRMLGKLEETVYADMLRSRTADGMGNSADVASFLFSLRDRRGLNKKVDFDNILASDGSQNIVFYIFYSAIIYHVALLMKKTVKSIPSHIAFSGNGSKILGILSPGSDHSPLSRLTEYIFEGVFGQGNPGSVVKPRGIDIIFNYNNSKELTCKGGLSLERQPVEVADKKVVLVGDEIVRTTSDARQESFEGVTYGTVSSRYPQVVGQIKDFFGLILTGINKKFLKDSFGISSESIDSALKLEESEDLCGYINKAVQLKKDNKEINDDDVIEEPLFFYPIIGVMNKLSGEIERQNRG